MYTKTLHVFKHHFMSLSTQNCLQIYCKCFNKSQSAASVQLQIMMLQLLELSIKYAANLLQMFQEYLLITSK